MNILTSSIFYNPDHYALKNDSIEEPYTHLFWDVVAKGALSLETIYFFKAVLQANPSTNRLSIKQKKFAKMSISILSGTSCIAATIDKNAYTLFLILLTIGNGTFPIYKTTQSRCSWEKLNQTSSRHTQTALLIGVLFMGRLGSIILNEKWAYTAAIQALFSICFLALTKYTAQKCQVPFTRSSSPSSVPSFYRSEILNHPLNCPPILKLSVNPLLPAHSNLEPIELVKVLMKMGLNNSSYRRTRSFVAEVVEKHYETIALSRFFPNATVVEMIQFASDFNIKKLNFGSFTLEDSHLKLIGEKLPELESLIIGTLPEEVCAFLNTTELPLDETVKVLHQQTFTEVGLEVLLSKITKIKSLSLMGLELTSNTFNLIANAKLTGLESLTVCVDDLIKKEHITKNEEILAHLTSLRISKCTGDAFLHILNSSPSLKSLDIDTDGKIETHYVERRWPSLEKLILRPLMVSAKPPQLLDSRLKYITTVSSLRHLEGHPNYFSGADRAAILKNTNLKVFNSHIPQYGLSRANPELSDPEKLTILKAVQNNTRLKGCQQDIFQLNQYVEYPLSQEKEVLSNLTCSLLKEREWEELQISCTINQKLSEVICKPKRLRTLEVKVHPHELNQAFAGNSSETRNSIAIFNCDLSNFFKTTPLLESIHLDLTPLNYGGDIQREMLLGIIKSRSFDRLRELKVVSCLKGDWLEMIKELTKCAPNLEILVLSDPRMASSPGRRDHERRQNDENSKEIFTELLKFKKLRSLSIHIFKKSQMRESPHLGSRLEYFGIPVLTDFLEGDDTVNYEPNFVLGVNEWLKQRPNRQLFSVVLSPRENE